MFGVLTHADEIRPDSQEFIDFEKMFKGCLGISSMRYLLCTNYHTNAPMTRNQNSNVDVTVVKFLQQVYGLFIFTRCSAKFINFLKSFSLFYMNNYGQRREENKLSSRKLLKHVHV